MRVLQIEDETWDSGIAHYALTLSAELQRRGHEVHFWGAEGSYALRQAAAAGLRTRGWRRPWACLHLLRHELAEARIQLVNAHTGSAHSLAALLAAGTGVPVVRTRGDARVGARHVLARALARRTRAFIAANSRIRAELLGAFKGARVELILQGIAAPAPAPPAERPLFGILGRLDPVKGHEVLLAAAASVVERHPEARFLVMGAGKPQRLDLLKRRAWELGLGGSWEFAGFVEDSAAGMASCRVGIVASTGSEAVSRAALEWMAAGRPLVASSVGCLPDLVDDGRTGFLVPPGDAGALAAVLQRFLDEPGLAALLGAEARRRFDERFSLARFADDTIRLYEDLLGHIPS